MSADEKCRNSSRKDAVSWGFALKRAVKRFLSRYRVNLLLFVLLVLTVTIWFYHHIHLYFTRTLFVGIPLTLVSFLELVRSFISEEAIGNRAPLFKRLLGTSSGTLYIILGLILIILFFLTTSSIYVEFDPASAKGTVEYQLDVTELIKVNDVNYTSQPYLKKLTVSSYDRIKGRPYFFHMSRLWNPIKLRFAIVNPYGYEPNEAELKPWSKAYFKVPRNFPKKKYHILRLMPTGNWLTQPPKLNETDLSKYILEISVNDSNDYKVDNVLLETICIGAGKEVIESMIAAEPRAKRYILMYSHLVKIGSEGQVEERARILTDSWRSHSTQELQPGDKVTVKLRDKVAKRIVTQNPPITWIVKETTGIQNVSVK